jgi:hypothetical protein
MEYWTKWTVALIATVATWVFVGIWLTHDVFGDAALGGLLTGWVPGLAVGAGVLRGFSKYEIAMAAHKREVERQELLQLGSADLAALTDMKRLFEQDSSDIGRQRVLRTDQLIEQARRNHIDEQHPDTMLDSIEARLQEDASAERQQRQELQEGQGPG